MEKRLVLLLIFAAMAGLSLANTESIITVDYSVDLGESNQVASGLLHGISAENPAQYLIDGIKVNSVRGADYYGNLPDCFDTATYDRIKATGAELVIGLYYGRGSYFPGDGGDWDTWRRICVDVYSEAQSKNYDIYSWIPWNEPRLQWSDLDRYMQAHDVAYKVIKSLNPDAKIQAPEDHAYSLSFMASFLIFCKENDCLPDVLSWHELSQEPLDIEDHCREITNWMQDNEITPMPLAVTEYQGSSYSNDNTSIPGVNVYYLASMERAVQYGFSFGLHSCWSWEGSNPDFIATLSDMANKDGANLPRGLWWNYNAYKEMTGRKVQVDVVGENGDALASFDEDMRKSIVLVGTRNYVTPHDLSLDLINIPDSLSFAGKVHIRVEMICDDMVVMSPQIVLEGDYTLSGDSVFLNLPTLTPKASYAIYVLPAKDASSVISYECESISAFSTNDSLLELYNETEASDGQVLVLEATEIGDSVEFQIPSLGEGVYNLSAVLKGAENYGFMQLYVDGQSVSQPEDLYRNAEYFYENDFGNIYIGPGELNLKFVVVGQNPSSSGKFLTFDRFDFTRLTEQILEPTNCEEVQAFGYRLAADLNGDCRVDIADLVLICAQWLVCNDPDVDGCIANW